MKKYSKEEIKELILAERLIGIVREKNYANLLTRAQSGINGGLKILEVTLNSERPFDAIRELNEKYEDNAVIGAGTVLSAEEGVKALMMGAKFLVSPVYVEEVNDLCKERQVLYIAGAATPTEVFSLIKKGMDLIKLFPANALGINYMKDISAPFDGVKFIAFGGIDMKNAKKWLDGGASAVAAGNALVCPDKDKCDADKIKSNVEKFIKTVKEG